MPITSNKTENLPFKPKARLVLHLGEQLLKTDGVALLELIKNSYDANATKVDLNLHDIHVNGSSKSKILIKDNGTGMTLDIVKNIWLVPGTDYKAPTSPQKKKFERNPIGEKGIGRFGAHRLGDKITLVTRAKNEKEVVIQIDWRKFDTGKFLKDVPITIISRAPEIFKGKDTGTQIEITGLRNAWDRRMIRDAFRAIYSLQSPFKALDSFDVELKHNLPDDFVDDVPSWSEIKEHRLHEFSCTIEGKKITSFTYRFLPPENIDVKKRTVSLESEQVTKQIELKTKDKEVIDLSNFEIGKIEFKGFLFNLDAPILSTFGITSRTLSPYLTQNGGVRVYRDGLRVFDYGEPGNDWLGLDSSRINTPAKKLGNGLIVSSIFISKLASSDLKEKSNREGFIDGPAFDAFKGAIHHVLNLIVQLRNHDKDLLNAAVRPKQSVSIEEDLIPQVRQKITNAVSEPSKLKSIFLDMDRLERQLTFLKAEYKSLSETNDEILKTASVGLSVTIIIHEVEKILKELKTRTKHTSDRDGIGDLVNQLSRLVESYSSLFRQKKRVNSNWEAVLNEVLFAVEWRLKHHAISVETHLNNCGNILFLANHALLVSSLLNIIDNSIWWLDYYKVKGKKIALHVHSSGGFIFLTIVDNGQGFSLPLTDITKPFVSTKPDGIGLGLHIVEQFVLHNKGKLSFTAPAGVKIDEKFSAGAIVSIGFPKIEE